MYIIAYRIVIVAKRSFKAARPLKGSKEKRNEQFVWQAGFKSRFTFLSIALSYHRLHEIGSADLSSVLQTEQLAYGSSQDRTYVSQTYFSDPYQLHFQLYL